MSLMNRFRRNGTPVEREPGAPDDQELPIPRYDRLDAKEITAQLSQLTQIELQIVEAHERAHENRPVVLDKLHYLHTVEPLPDYDTLETEQVVEALEGADGQTLRAVRDYERKFRRRKGVSDATAEMLPTSQLSDSEASAQAEKAARVRSKTGSSPPPKGRVAPTDSGE
jgi:hypothetical protein